MRKLTYLALFGLSTAALSGQILKTYYEQSFDYEAADNGNRFNETNFPGEGWTENTGVVTYQHAAGLSYAGLSPSGGALQYDFDGGTGNRNATQTLSENLSFANYEAGDIFGFTALMRVDRALNDGATVELQFDGNNVVNRPKLILTPDEMQVEVWANGALNTVSGPSYGVGDALAFHMQLEKGTTDDNNIVSIWFNPADLTDLGAPDFVSTSDTRFGRDAGTLTDVVYRGSNVGDTQWTIDEVSIVVIPEPSTYAALFGLLALGIVAWRRRR